MTVIDESAILVLAQLRADLASGRAREIRERARVSQADVAQALGTDAPTVSRWETGQSVPSRRNAARYAELLWKLDQIGRSDTAEA